MEPHVDLLLSLVELLWVAVYNKSCNFSYCQWQYQKKK